MPFLEFLYKSALAKQTSFWFRARGRLPWRQRITRALHGRSALTSAARRCARAWLSTFPPLFFMFRTAPSSARTRDLVSLDGVPLYRVIGGWRSDQLRGGTETLFAIPLRHASVDCTEDVRAFADASLQLPAERVGAYAPACLDIGGPAAR